MQVYAIGRWKDLLIILKLGTSSLRTNVVFQIFSYLKGKCHVNAVLAS